MACPLRTISYNPALDTSIDICHRNPSLMSFEKRSGDTKQYYLQNNPWQFFRWNKYQKIYLFCVICGKKRFTDREWDFASVLHNGVAVCLNSACYTASFDILDYVPESYFFNK